MSEQITKIKVNNDQTATINFKETGDLDTKEIVFSGKEKITDEFNKAFQESVFSFVEICPAFQKYVDKLTMNAIKFDYLNDDLAKVSFAVKYQPQTNIIANVPINNVPIYKEEFADKTFSVSGKDEQLLYKILEYAEKYIKGDTKTQQMKIEVA